MVWPDNVDDDGQLRTAVVNWRQSFETRKTKKNRVTTRRQTGTLLPFVFRGYVIWPDNVEDDVQRDTAVGNWRQSREARKAKKSSEDAATDGDSNASILRSDVVWLENVENDDQRETAVGNWRQLPEAKKAKKIE